MKIAVAIVIIIVFAFGGCTYTRDFYGMELVDNPKAQDVDSAILLMFLERDATNETPPYIVNSEEAMEIMDNPNWDRKLLGYSCIHFAHDLHNNAEAEGICCAVVWTTNRGHTFNAFHTTDRGIVFVDASTGIDGFAYDVDGKMMVDAKVREGVAISCTIILGEVEGFTIEW